MVAGGSGTPQAAIDRYFFTGFAAAGSVGSVNGKNVQAGLLRMKFERGDSHRRRERAAARPDRPATASPCETPARPRWGPGRSCGFPSWALRTSIQ